MTAALVKSFFFSQPAMAEIALEIAVKAALLCLVVWVAHLIVGRKRLLLRSALWQLCLVGLLLLPMTVIIAPRLPVVTRFAERRVESSHLASTEMKSAGNVAHLAPHDSTDGRQSPTTAAVFETAAEFSDTRTAQHAADDNAVRADTSATWLQFSEIGVVAAAAVYIVTLVILLIRLGASLTAVAVLRSEGLAVMNPAWLHALARWRSQFALGPAVQLLVSERVSVPMVVGCRRPAILLPTRLAETNDREAIDAVLLHELTHVGRGDFAWNVLLRIVRAIYWPHPFVWFAGRMVCQVREDVCDSVCVHWMGDVRTYCAILVDVAAGLVKSSEVALGMAMSSSSRLGRRLARVEQTSGTDRGLIGRPAHAMIALLVIVGTCLLGTVQIVSRVWGAEQSPADSTARSLPDAKAQSPTGAAANDGVAAVDKLPIEETTADATQAADESKPLRIMTTKVQRGMLQRMTEDYATLEPFGEVSIHSRNAGVISKVMVNVGDRVQAGDVLAELDALDIGAEIVEKEGALALAEANEEHAKVVIEAAQSAVQALAAKLAEAEVDGEKAASHEKFRALQYDRIKRLFESNSVDERLVDEKTEQLQAAILQTLSAIATIKSAKAVCANGDIDVLLAKSSLKPATLRVATAKADLKRARSKTGDAFRLIRSPIDGVVLEQNIEADVSVKPGDGKPMFKLAATGLITAVVLVHERDALLVKRNDAATVELPEVGPIAGKVSRVAYRFNPMTHQLRTEITLPNADGKLKPGLFGRATIFLGEVPPELLWVPASAVGEMDANSTAGICVRSVSRHAVRTRVKLGRNNGKQYEILEGLSEGDVVAVDFQKAPPGGEPLLDPILPPALPK